MNRCRTFLPALALLIMSAAVVLAAGQCRAATVRDVYPGLSSGPLERAVLSQLPKGTILRSGQVVVTQKNINEDVARAPQSARAELKRNLFYVLESRAMQALMTREATAWASKNRRAQSGGNEALLSAYAGSLASGITVSDHEVSDFYNSNKQTVDGADFEKVKREMKSYLLQEKRSKAVEAHVSSLSVRHKIEIDKSWVAKQYAPSMNNPVDKARGSGKPTMVEFGSEGCTYCKMMVPILASLRRDHAGKLNVVYIDVKKEQVLAARFGIQSIPVQVFFDKIGQKSYQHIGFFSREQIDAQLVKLGVK